MTHTVTAEETMVNLTFADGLAGESVYRVMTDHNGQIWLATTNGVSRYNGKKLITYNLTTTGFRTIVVSDICEMADGTIYAATDRGLLRLAHGADQFEHVLSEVTRPECLFADGDTLYIGGRQGLMIFDGHRLKTRNLGPSRKDLDNIVRQYVKDDKGCIWFLGRYDLNRYDTKADTVAKFELRDLPENTALSQFALVGDKAFIGTKGHGLYVYRLKTGEMRMVENVGNVITAVCASDDGHVCVSTDGSGAYLVNSETEKVDEQFGAQQPEGHFLPTNALNCYYRDANGVDWFGFIRFGLAYTYHCGTLFQPYVSDSFSALGMNVRSYCLRDGEAIIGLQNGFYYIDANTHTVRFYSPEDYNGGHIVTSVLFHEGLYYVGTFDGGMRCLDPKTGLFVPQRIDPKLDVANISDMKLSPVDGSLWIGCNEGLYIVDKTGKVRHFTEQNSHIVGGQIVSIAFNRQGDAWLAGAAGVSFYSAATHNIVDIIYPEGFFNTQPWMRLSLGHDGYMFMRTGAQVFYTDERLKDFGELQLPIDLIDAWTRDFIDDGRGYYWLASEMGLFRFEYGDSRSTVGDMLHLGYGEGLRGDHINSMSIDRQQTLWVATSEGLFYLSLGDQVVKSGKENYQVQLFNIRRGSDLLRNGEEYVVNEKHYIRLAWTFASEVLQVEPLLMDYAKQRGRLYQYQIDGGEWQTTIDGEPIAVRGLWPGNHRLTVRLAGVDTTATVYTISVRPSTIVYICILLVILSLLLLYLWYAYRRNTRKLLTERDEIEDALVQMEAELQEANKEEALVRKEESGETSQKYQKVKLDEAECADIVKRMRKYIEAGKLYTNPDMKMKDLADMLHLSPSKLSQVFNLYLNENYYEFMNRYRLDEFKRLIETGEYKVYTITALSERCGFKKSSFFATFRKIEGMTPAEYLRKKGIDS